MIVRVQFDPAFKDDLHSRSNEDCLTVRYDEHPHVVSFFISREDYTTVRRACYLLNHL